MFLIPPGGTFDYQVTAGHQINYIKDRVWSGLLKVISIGRMASYKTLKKQNKKYFKIFLVIGDLISTCPSNYF